MRANEFLFESSGLFGRKQGDPFTHSSGVQAEFIEVGGYPYMTYLKSKARILDSITL